MKKILFVVGFISFFIGIIQFFPPNEKILKTATNSTQVVNINSTTPPKKDHSKEQKNSNIYWTLWEEQSKDVSLLPSNIDSIVKVEEQNIYKNFYHGYSIAYPSKWSIDKHLSNRYIRLYDKKFRVDLTIQDSRRAWTTPSDYIKNTLNSIENYVTDDIEWSENGNQMRLVEYSRKPLKTIKEDLTNYQYGFITVGHVVYTFHAKTKEKFSYLTRKELVELMNTFRNIKKTEIDLTSELDNKEFNPIIDEHFSEGHLSIPQNSFMMGMHVENSDNIHELDYILNTHLGSQLFYKSINSIFDDYFIQTLKEKRLPNITFLLETVNEKEANIEILQQIIDGQYDDNILSWAQGIKELNSPVFIRFGNEMNGAWSNWSHKYAYNDEDLYKLAYRHFVDIFRAENTSNVFFVWNPNENSNPYYSWNHASMYYPGDNYVDWVGLTAYNFGKTQWGNFRYFDDLYADLYEDYLISFPNKPFMIGEFGSVETGGNKERFIQEMFEKIPTQYTNIKLAYWFHEKHHPYDFKVTTSLSSKNAFIRGMKNENVIKELQ